MWPKNPIMDREMLGPAWEMWRREKNASFLVILAIKFESSWSDHGKPLAGLNEFMSFKLFLNALICSRVWLRVPNSKFNDLCLFYMIVLNNDLEKFLNFYM